MQIPPTDSAPENFMLKDIIQHLADRAQPRPTVPMGTPAPTSEPTPPQDSPRPTTVAGYTQGDEVTAAVSRKTCPHPKMLFIEVPEWEGLAVTYVQEKKDWRTGDRMTVRFARMRPDYTLEFDGPRGPHRNKFGRRP